MRSHAVWILLVALALGGCARKTEVVRVIEYAPPPPEWVGRSAAEVVDTFGSPTERRSDGQGGSILVYRRELPVRVGQTQKPNWPSVGDPPKQPTDPEWNVVTRDVAKFWIDPDGQVYREWLDPQHVDRLRRGKGRPAEKSGAGEDDEPDGGEE